MTRKKTKTPARELVRLTPMQFSIAAAVVVFIATATFLFGYRIGLEASMATRVVGEAVDGPEASREPGPAEAKGSPSGTHVTFYEALTRREEAAAGAGRRIRIHSPDEEVGDREEARAAPAPAVGEGENPAAPSRLQEALMVQAASFSRSDQARELLNSLRKEGFAGTVMRADLGERGVWYRVRIGPLNGKPEAEEVLAAILAKRGLKGYIVR